MTPPILILTLPWLGLLVFVFFVVKMPRELPCPAGVRAAAAPFVSVVVPARHEAHNIVTCLESLAASTYPDFEIIAVDDRSTDRTGELARAVGAGNARRLVVVEGTELPTDWLGKPWACRQGAQESRGDLLLFTDADTVHGPDLLHRAVAGREEEEADLLTVVGRQLMVTFWERLVQPQIFLVMLFRFPNWERALKNPHWRDAVANGQYMLFRRAAYEAIGGHAAVKNQVVEDLALAQLVKREGYRLRIRSAETDLATRMYRSLAELVAGWSKNIVTGGMQSLPPWMRPVAPPVSLLLGVGLWLVPPAALGAASVGFGGGALLAWAATVCVLSALLWMTFTRRMGAPAVYGLLYPAGAAVGAYIFLRSWVRGRRVEWKGRRYVVPPVSDHD